MATDRWNPFQEMLTLRQAMDRLMEESYVRPGSAGLPSGGHGAPGAQAAQGMQGMQSGFPIDVAETDDAFDIRATLPGVRPEDVQITVHNDTLLIRGQSRHDDERREGRGQRWLVREHRSQAFQRAIGLPSAVDPDRGDAHFEHGVLRLTLPKSQNARPRQIHVRGQAPGQGQLGQAGQMGQQGQHANLGGQFTVHQGANGSTHQSTSAGAAGAADVPGDEPANGAAAKPIKRRTDGAANSGRSSKADVGSGAH